MSIKAMLDATCDEIAEIDQMVERAKVTRDRVLLAQITQQLKSIAPKLKQLSAHPECAQEDNNRKLQELSNKLRDAVVAMKAINQEKKEDVSEDDRTRANPMVAGTTPNGGPSQTTSQPVTRAGERSLSPRMSLPGAIAPISFSATDAPINMKGYLKKQGEDLMKQWKLRYFDLRGDQLSYYKNERDSAPIGVIDLNQVVKVSMVDRIRACFDLEVPKRVYHLQANTQTEAMQWMEALTKHTPAVRTRRQSVSHMEPPSTPEQGSVAADHNSLSYTMPAGNGSGSFRSFKELPYEPSAPSSASPAIVPTPPSQPQPQPPSQPQPQPPSQPHPQPQPQVPVQQASPSVQQKKDKKSKVKDSQIIKQQEQALKQKDEQIASLNKKVDELEDKLTHLEYYQTKCNALDQFVKSLEKDMKDKEAALALLNNKMLACSEQEKIALKRLEATSLELAQVRKDLAEKDKAIRSISENTKTGSQKFASNKNQKELLASLQDAVLAHQNHNTFLSNELQRIEKDKEMVLGVKDETITHLQNELNLAIASFQNMRSSLLECLTRGGVDPNYLDDLDHIKQDYFMSLALSVKLSNAEKGIISNFDAVQLYDTCTKENVSYKQWPDWIQTKVAPPSSASHESAKLRRPETHK